jgi:DNA primase catalytic core
LLLRNHPRNTLGLVLNKIKIEELIGENVSLTPRGDELVGAHHTHDSQSGTSFTVNPAKQLYHCFNCGEGGNAINWVMNTHRITFMEALRILAARLGIPLDELDSEEAKQWSQMQDERKTVEHIFEEACRFYEANMPDQIRSYLNQRGISDETIKKQRLGFAPRDGPSLLDHLLEIGHHQLAKSGLFIVKSEELAFDLFQGRLMIPYLANHRPMYFIGRQTEFTPDKPWEAGKYKKLLTHSNAHPYVSPTVQNRYLFGTDSLRPGELVIVTEGIMDAIMAIQAGYSCISPATVRFAKKDFPLLLRETRRSSRTYIVNDSEDNEAGQKGAVATAGFLESKGRQALLVELPRQNGVDKVDLADFLHQEGPEELKKLLQTAKPLYGWQLEQAVKPDQKELSLPAARDFVLSDLSRLSDEFLVAGFIREKVVPHFGLKMGDAKALVKVWKDNRSETPEEVATTGEAWDPASEDEDNHDEPTLEEIRERYFVGKDFSPQLMGTEIITEIPLIFYGNQIHTYSDGVYQTVDHRLRQIIQTKLGLLSVKRYINESEEWLKVQCSSETDKINTQTNVLNLKNGLLNVFTGEFKEHTPEFLSTVRIPVEYDRNAKAPLWEKFLSEVVPEDCILALWEFVGYCLLPDTRFETNLMLTGSGANGKSVLLKAVAALIGVKNMANVPLQELSENRFKRAELAGKLVNIFSDLSSRAIQDSAFFKIITSGDPIDAERKFQHPFQFTPFARLLFSANELPATTDNTDGFFRRWLIIPFPNSFPPEKRDVRLIEKLTTPEELSGALNLAIEGLQRLYRQGRFSTSETIASQLKEYRLRSDPVAAFVAECCVIEEFAIISKAELYNAYRNWTFESGSKTMSQKRFGPLIRNLEGIDETRDSGTRSWIGIGLRNSKSTLRSVK